MEKLNQEEFDNLKKSKLKIMELSEEYVYAVMMEKNFSNEKERLLFEANQANASFNDLQKGITEKYGNISVNMQTGEITHNGD